MILFLLKRVLPLILVALYFLSPIDIIPDVLVGPGWIDDLILVGLLIWYLSGRPIPFFTRFGPPFGRTQQQSGRTSQRPSDSSRPDNVDKTGDDPYVTLGVKPGANKEEIKEAYRIAVSKYHPDKVSHLGRELQDLAHRKFLAIQRAYDRLMKQQ